MSKRTNPDHRPARAKDPLASVAGSGSAQDIARQLAAVDGPSGTLKEVSQGLSRYTDALRASLPAAGIEKAFGPRGADGVTATTLAAALAAIEVKLPDPSRMTSASLPRPLQGPHLQAREDGAPPAVIADGPEGRMSDADGPDVEIGSPADLGRLVRQAREKRLMSQQDFADLAGVGRRFVSELENGKATLELGKVIKVARAAGLSLLARGR